MSGPLDLSHDKLVEAIAAEEDKAHGGHSLSYRAALDVSLAQGLRRMIANLAEATERSAKDLREELSRFRTALDEFRLSMNQGGRKMVWLTGALFFVGALQAVAMLVQVWPAISRWFQRWLPPRLRVPRGLAVLWGVGPR